jgi:hypothetical protein
MYCSPNNVRVINQIKNSETGGAYSTYGGEKCTLFWWGDVRKRDNLEELGVDGSVISKWIFKKVGWGGMEWIALAQDWDRWRSLVNSVMNLRVP